MPEAATAISLLEKLLAEVGPSRMPYWICPNMILTFAGARGYGDGVFWGSKKQVALWQQEINEGLAALKRITDIYMAEAETTSSAMGEHGAAYDLVLRSGLDYSLKTTDILSFEPASIKKPNPGSVMEALCAAASKKHGEDLTQEEIRHAAFGVMLGYPDNAILGAIKAWRTENDPFAERTIEADIRGADYLQCPQPVYDYPHHLATDPDIQAHEQRWSKIIKDFYTSDFYRKLAANAEFKAKLSQLDI